MTDRAYEEQCPWIDFTFPITLNPLWLRFGEAFSKCQHLAGSPLPPAVAGDLASIFLVKGALATTAIEGNTLSEDEAKRILSEHLRLPPSQQYLEQELRNIAFALDGIYKSALSANTFQITPEWIKEQNRIVLQNLELEDHVTPGEYTSSRLVVGSYRAAPPDDVEYLVDRLCEWLNREWLTPMHDVSTSPDMQFVYAFFAATLAHLYIAWIHPFGDGNGRTARLLECSILAHSGVVPWVSSNVLSDFYNRTRSMYYRRLAAASQKRDVMGFIEYSAGGFVDMLREQIDTVRKLERRSAWVNYVHDRLRNETSGKAKDRRRMLVLAMPLDSPTAKRAVRGLTVDLAAAYAGKDDKTISRDLGKLTELGLISEVAPRQYELNVRIMDAFLPIASKWAPESAWSG